MYDINFGGYVVENADIKSVRELGTNEQNEYDFHGVGDVYKDGDVIAFCADIYIKRDSLAPETKEQYMVLTV